MSHVCHAVGCNVPIPEQLFMCSKHWYKLPKVYRNVLLHYYQPSLDYIAVAFAGIACVALQEGREPPRFVQSAPELQSQVLEEPRQAPIDKERAGELQ